MTMDKAIANFDHAAWLELARKRRLEALRLHREGRSFAEVGDVLGITRQRAYTLVQAARKETSE